MSSEPDTDRSPAPLRVTSGAGFDFEDRVNAWLLMKMLVGEPVAAIGGRGTRVQAQVATLDWTIDDLLVTSRQHDGSLRKLAISCKGNVQVSGAALPASFVSAAWAQWLHPDNPLSASKDDLALITAARHAEFDAIWREIKHACDNADPALGLSRIRANAKQSRLFDSVRTKVSGEQASEAETRELIQRLHVLPIELHAADALRENEAIAQCRQLLASIDLAEAEALWEQLLTMAKKARLERGTIDLLDAWAQLRVRFALRDHPDYQSDWTILAGYSTDQRSRIEAALPNGHSLVRTELSTKLLETVRAEVVSVVVGESGSGKSALVKRVLDAHLPSAAQLWLGPEETAIVLSAARRGTAGLRHDLSELMRGTRARESVLVLDSIERLDPALLAGLRALLSGMSTQPAGDTVPWRLVVTTQHQGLALARAISTQGHGVVEVGPLSASEVKEAVAASPALKWLTSHDSTIEALTSLKALAWVLGASLTAPAKALASHLDVVDVLWEYWTQDNLATHALLTQLGERDAGPDRSVPISTLDAGQLQAFQASRATLPLRVDTTNNRLRFEHDLAADWARFQRLKELSNDPQAWAALASNPCWTNALRLLGQRLLRRPPGEGDAWLEAFDVSSPQAGLVQGILFDAICQDPQALIFLTQRADWLLDNRGRRLNQLLNRFLHLATVPAQPIQATGGWLELYAEAHRRTIVIGRWVPMLQFVLAQTDKLADLLSSPLARFTHSWLMQTPLTIGESQPTPFRRELAELALAVVRTIQVHKGVGDMLIDLEPDFFAAALAGAPDCPTAVPELALELCGRRSRNATTATRIQQLRSERQAQDERRLAADPALRARREAARQMGKVIGLGREKLPPWPIGAMHPVDRDFRKACFKNGILEPLMRADPATAAEVLLALIVDDTPERDFDAGRRPHREHLGLACPEDPFPSIFWKSPFWPFLQIAPDYAIPALLQLVAFCTDRWGEGARGSKRPGLDICVSGATRRFEGGSDVLAWSQNADSQTANLHGALDSLERWMVTRIDAGLDVAPTASHLLAASQSMAIIGVLLNIGKHTPALFSGPLSPLLSKAQLYRWDNSRVEHVDQNFTINFASSGEQLFEFAKQWVLAPHRRVGLLEVAIELIASTPALADDVRAWVATWSTPDDSKAALERRILIAQLDSTNYRRDHKGQLQFAAPSELVNEVQAWEETHAPSRRQLTAPYQCQQLLDAGQPISPAHAAALYEILEIAANDEAWVQQRCERAVAATLTMLAPDWLTDNASAQGRIAAILDGTLASLPSTAEELHEARFPTTHTGMDFVARALTRQWVQAPDREAELRVVRLLTSGDRLAAQSVVAEAYSNHQVLGERWWRLLYVGLLWSGLNMLGPRYGDEDVVGRVWTTWWRRLRKISLGVACKPDRLDVVRMDAGCARVMYRRQLRAHQADSSQTHPDFLAGASLDTQLLDDLFTWLLRGVGTEDADIDRALVLRFWQLEVAHAREHARDEDGELHLTGQFAYHVLEKLASLAISAPQHLAQRVWQPVLEVGPAGHIALRHFVRALFVALSKGANPQRFEALWHALGNYALAANWNLPGLWFHGEEIRRLILGFGSEWTLGNLPAGAALRMKATLEAWANTHLQREDNLAALCVFLASPFGSPVRLDGLLWIQATLEAKETAFRFHRDTSGDALIELIVTVLQHDVAVVRKQPNVRKALMEIAAALASTGRQDALAIQDRLRALV